MNSYTYSKHHMNGFLFATASGTRLFPITKGGGSKQFLLFYDKSMEYYPSEG